MQVCPVCDSALSPSRSDFEEAEAHCRRCGLYDCEFAYGGFRSRFGFATLCWTWDQPRPGEYAAAVAEASRMAASTCPDLRALLEANRVCPDDRMLCALEDYFIENDYPLNAQTLACKRTPR